MGKIEEMANAIGGVEEDGISIRAFFIALWEQRFSEPPDMEESEAIFCRMANAALEAMREPTEAMLDAAYGLSDSPSPESAWTAMIDAAKAGR